MKSLIISRSFGTQPKTSLVSKASSRPSFGTGPRVAVHCPLVRSKRCFRRKTHTAGGEVTEGSGIPSSHHDQQVACWGCKRRVKLRWAGEKRLNADGRERVGPDSRARRDPGLNWNTCVHKQGFCLSSADKWAAVKQKLRGILWKNTIWTL